MTLRELINRLEELSDNGKNDSLDVKFKGYGALEYKLEDIDIDFWGYYEYVQFLIDPPIVERPGSEITMKGLYE